MKTKPIVAAFDFDGTITYTDTLVYFFFFAAGKLKGFLYSLRLLASFVLFLTDQISRQEFKERALTLFFKGVPIKKLNKIGENYMKAKLPKAVRSEALNKIAWHRKQGHRLILISASLDLYLKPWAKEYQFDDLLCTGLEVDKTGCVTGKIEGINCRAQEKVRRLNELLGPRESYELYAYGDSAGDKELLAYADRSFLHPF